MAFEIRPNSGSVFVNDRKDDNPKAPDRTGQGLLECPHCGKSWGIWISGWLKESKGKKFMSLAFQKKEDKGARRDDRGGAGQRRDDRDDDRGGGRRSGPDTRGSYRDKDDLDIPFAWLIVTGALLMLSTAHGFIA